MGQKAIERSKETVQKRGGTARGSKGVQLKRAYRYVLEGGSRDWGRTLTVYRWLENRHVPDQEFREIWQKDRGTTKK